MEKIVQTFKSFINEISVKCIIETYRLQEKYDAHKINSDVNAGDIFSRKLRWLVVKPQPRYSAPEMIMHYKDKNFISEVYGKRATRIDLKKAEEFYLTQSLILKLKTIKDSELHSAAVGFQLGLMYADLKSKLTKSKINFNELLEILVRGELIKDSEKSSNNLAIDLTTPATFEEFQLTYLGKIIFKANFKSTKLLEKLVFFDENDSEHTVKIKTISNEIATIKDDMGLKLKTSRRSKSLFQ